MCESKNVVKRCADCEKEIVFKKRVGDGEQYQDYCINCGKWVLETHLWWLVISHNPQAGDVFERFYYDKSKEKK